MNEQLLLNNVRGVLIRLEESFIFALIERAQFRVNAPAYQPDANGVAIHGESLVEYLLHETERIHARVRRYTSPDEHPFFDDLPTPALPALRYDENPLRPNTVSINAEIRRVYEREIVPFICGPGDDGQYGSTAVCDTQCLQVLSKRIHYGKFVAESKLVAAPERFQALIAAGDAAGLEAAITDPAVEATVLERVRRKARTYGDEIGSDADRSRIDAERVMAVYARWIIPLTRKVQVLYLLDCGLPREKDDVIGTR